MKSTDIIMEELKKEGLIVAEAVAQKLEQCIFHKIVPRLAAEADEPAVKMIAGGAMMVIPALEPVVEKAIDGISPEVAV